MLRLPIAALLLATTLPAETSDSTLFENKIRPILATKCYGCHSSSLKAPMGGLVLDTKAGLSKVVVAGKPDESRILSALSYADMQLQMPPSGKLPDAVLADFRQWIAAGAIDPRKDAVAETTSSPQYKGMPIEEGRKWWAFQPVKPQPLPKVAPSAATAGWRGPIDAFILAKLQKAKLQPSAPADARTLVRRAYIDLVGYKPTFEEVEAFANDKSPQAWTKLIDRLQSSPQYGERWGRHWMDVARFGEDNPTSEATNPPYPYAWRYRDWIIEAMNRDVPYDRFVTLQLAADLLPGTRRADMRALGYLGAAPIYHKDQRLSADVIGGFMTDDWDERVDAVSRGLLGMTVGCARCHDHKFDPILTKDYYGLVGVFASTMRAERPLFDVDPKVETRYLWIQDRLFDLRYSYNLLTGEASTVVDSKSRTDRWKAEIETLKAEMLGLQDKYPQLVKSVEKYWNFAPRERRTQAGGANRRGRTFTATEPFMNAVYDAAQYVDGSDPHYTFIVYKPGEARDFPVLPHGNVATPGQIVPRHFLTVLSKGDRTFRKGSGRLELAQNIFGDGAPLAARVIVNRVWAWHFGKPLVATPSDFGVQGEKPTHPELLDDLSARFIAHGWSIKWLNREIMLSAAYRQESRPRPDAEKVDQMNALLWRMNPRRMNVESYRDSLLRAAGRLSAEMYGPSQDVEAPGNVRRTVYGRVSRGRLDNLLKQYDFPDPMQTSGGRDLTTTSLQQLFVMNSAFMHDQAVALAANVAKQRDAGMTMKLRSMYRKVLSREPSSNEMDLAFRYVGTGGTLEQYAQILLSTNEEIFWP